MMQASVFEVQEVVSPRTGRSFSRSPAALAAQTFIFTGAAIGGTRTAEILAAPRVEGGRREERVASTAIRREVAMIIGMRSGSDVGLIDLAWRIKLPRS
jgi:hypothetical protein